MGLPKLSKTFTRLRVEFVLYHFSLKKSQLRPTLLYSENFIFQSILEKTIINAFKVNHLGNNKHFLQCKLCHFGNVKLKIVLKSIKNPPDNSLLVLL